MMSEKERELASTGEAGASAVVTTTSSTSIRRASPPQAVQKVRENYFLVQLLLSGSPSADWRRLFYEAKHDAAAEFQPRSVEISGALMRFRSEPASVEARLALIERWIAFANEKEAGMANRSEDQRRKNQELAREAEELGQWNSRWAKL